MTVNESTFSVTGYVATNPVRTVTSTGMPTMTMRLAWTPRKLDRDTGSWADEATSFATVRAFRSLAENGYLSLRKGDPVVVSGNLRIREYDAKDGTRRTAVEVTANAIGHDLAKGVATFDKLRRGPSTEERAAQQAPGEQAEPGAAEDEFAAAGPGDPEFDGATLALAQDQDAADGIPEDPPVESAAVPA